MPYSQSFSAFSNSSLRNFDIALYSLYYSSLEYVRPRNRVYAVSALRNRTFQLHNSRIGSCPGLLSVCEGVASRG